MKISVIIPCHNEEKTLETILEQVHSSLLSLNYDYEIFIVDDGSTDKTKDILEKIKDKYSLNILINNKKEGKGKAIQNAIKNISGDIVIIQDADLEYDPRDYDKLTQPIINGETNIVYGSRILEGNNKSSNLWFYLGGIFITKLINILFGCKSTDVTSGYKVFRKQSLEKINLVYPDFRFCIEVTIKALKNKEKIIEIPISYQPRTKEEGKKIRFRDGILDIISILKLRFYE